MLNFRGPGSLDAMSSLRSLSIPSMLGGLILEHICPLPSPRTDPSIPASGAYQDWRPQAAIGSNSTNHFCCPTSAAPGFG